ncbi:Zinc-responsive transcriptional regulator ZAP1 [Cyberlindnera fabianii]|uniref:Zinc-responsive transcriptional regulator ZAP1 n=1 Tax=Cyberlindnera fabianii TaxID=36022 RepID=A0A1V2LDQ2_CYBFA|nr:Zinc-responsive transcriptional regulator ZAP1 [Cyberlindnera fabianii]
MPTTGDRMSLGQHHNEDSYQMLKDLEADISKYSLDERSMSLPVPISEATVTSPSSTSATGSVSPAAGSSSTARQPNFFDAMAMNNGLIHGHVHNFNNFTYIHGHIHTNDTMLLEGMDFTQQAQQQQALPKLRRQSSHHQHLNDRHSSQFTDCQHFEFLNCHDQQSKPVIVENPNLTCEEDVNCKPKLLEICCDNSHPDGSSTAPLFPDLVNLPMGQQLHDDSFSHSNDDKTFEHCNFEDCIDVKCDLDTCDIDELYCKFCEDPDSMPDLKCDFENKDSQTVHNHAHAHSHSHSHIHTHDHDNNHTHIDQHLLQLITPAATQHKQKRSREDEDKPAIHHHLHHHQQHSHPENHHHHHIQLHDHQHAAKKVKNESGANSLINFEWNFKNQQAKCEWDTCSSQFDNTLLLQNHIVENHLVPEFNINTSLGDINDSLAYECEWKNCDFSGDGMTSLITHINSQHSGYPSNPIDELISQSQKKPLLTPSPDNDHISPQKDVSSNLADTSADDEATTCRWMVQDSTDSEPHPCGAQFSSAEELTNHLVEDHVGSGQSVYVCSWEGCDRNGQEFRQRQKALRHLHTHTHYKPLQCKVCGRRFAVDTMLTQHMRTHSGEKPYKCPTCDKRFATSSSLSVHLRTHTGEKPLMCKYPGCGKRFSESSNLTKHMKIHEKEFKCSCCLRSFATLKQLKSHNSKYHADLQ